MRAASLAGIEFEGDVNLTEIDFCKIEAQQECLQGTLSIPKLIDIQNSRYKIMLLINENCIVIIDDDDFTQRQIMGILRSRPQKTRSIERFLYCFFTGFMNRYTKLLSEHEKKIMALEESVQQGKTEDFHEKIMPVRKELLTLESYFDELTDMGKELEQDENEFFDEDQLKYFGVITDRADRLKNRTSHLLEYARQVNDAYQAEVDAVQNKNMEFLTVISTLFFPLTLITGWYGMNFENMPELKSGYPGVIALSVLVVVICIAIFKHKKMF